MRNAVLTLFGLVGLSAAGGAALVASHSALAAGPRLPDTVLRAHATAAIHSENVVAVALTSEVYEQAAGALGDTARDSTDPNPVIDTQDGTFGLAPVRALRPISRDENSDRANPERIAQAIPTQQSPAASQGAQVAPNSAARGPALRPAAQPRLTRTAGRVEPRYLHGVFR